METLLLTNFAGINLRTPSEELSIDPVESPNIINEVMEEGTIFCRPPINIHHSFSSGNVLAYYQGKLGNDIIQIAQIDTVIKKKGGSAKIWWNEAWNYYKEKILTNTSYTDYYNLLLDWRLPIGFDYSNIKPNGDDLRFIIFEDNQFKDLAYWIKEWNKDPITLLPVTAIIPTMSLTIQPTVASNLEFTVAGATAWGNITIAGKNDAGGNLNETLTWIANGTKTTVNKFKSVNTNGITTSGFTGGTLAVQYKKETIIYVKIPQIKAQQKLIVQMYYGNTGAEAVSQNLYTLYFNYDSSDDIKDIIYGRAPANYLTGYVSNGQWTIKTNPTGSGNSTDLVVHTKSFNNIPILFESTGIISLEGLYLRGSTDNVITYGMITLQYGMFYMDGNWRTGYFLGGFKDWGQYGNSSYWTYLQCSIPSGSPHSYSLYFNPITQQATGIIKVNGNIVFNRIITFPSKIMDLFFISWNPIIDGDIYHQITTIDNTQVSNFLPDTITQTAMGAEQTKPVANTWTDLITGWSNKPTQILTFLNKFIFVNEERNVTIWDGTTLQELPTDQPTGKFRAKFGLVHKNRLWLFNFPGSSGSMIRYSNINLISILDNWKTSGIENYAYINQDDGFEIAGVGIISDGILIPKENTGHLWYGEIPNHAVKKLNLDVGCLAWRSIQEWENGDFFLSKKGIHFVRGAVAETPIIFTVDNIATDNIAEKLLSLFNNLNKDYLQNAIGMMWNDRYYCAVPGHDSTQNNILLVLDYKRGWWTYWIPPEPITCMFVDADNIFTLGTVGGNLRHHGTRNPADEVLPEDGLAITNRYDTGKMDLVIPNVRKRLRMIEPVFSGNMTLELLVDGTSKVTQDLVGGTRLTKKRIPVLEVGYFFQLGFSNLSKQLHSVKLTYEYLRT